MAESSSWFHDPKYQNYMKHMDMIQKQAAEQHHINEQYSTAHWRSVALGLHHENQMLHQMVQQLLGMSVQNVQEHHFPTENENIRRYPKDEVKSESEKETSPYEEENEYEVESENEDSMEEYLKFVQETEKHKERRERERQLEEGGGSTQEKKFNPADEIVTDDILDRAEDIATDFELLKKEMSDLYGKDALKVGLSVY